ncbi:MAG: hypothetical protein HZC28_20405 [Spirochaetes bacterium]|nr:hypothetical protein [Spirochaetota bacterium]
MDMLAFTVEIRKRRFTFPELLYAAYALFIRYFRVLFLITIIVSIPVNVLRVVLKPVNDRAAAYTLSVSEQQLFPRMKPGMDAASYDTFVKQYRELLPVAVDVVGFFLGFIEILASMAVIFMANEVVNGGRASVRSGFAKALSRWPYAAGAHLLSTLAVAGGLLLFIIPGVILYVRYIFCIEAAVLRNTGFAGALQYSTDLVRGKWIEVFAFVILLLIGANMINLLIMTPFIELRENIPVRVLSGTLFSIFFNYFSLCSVLFFLNLDFTRSKEA